MSSHWEPKFGTNNHRSSWQEGPFQGTASDGSRRPCGICATLVVGRASSGEMIEQNKKRSPKRPSLAAFPATLHSERSASEPRLPASANTASLGAAVGRTALGRWQREARFLPAVAQPFDGTASFPAFDPLAHTPFSDAPSSGKRLLAWRAAHVQEVSQRSLACVDAETFHGKLGNLPTFHTAARESGGPKEDAPEFQRHGE